MGESELGRSGWEVRPEKRDMALPFPSHSPGKDVKTLLQNLPLILKDEAVVADSRQQDGLVKALRMPSNNLGASQA